MGPKTEDFDIMRMQMEHYICTHLLVEYMWTHPSINPYSDSI